MFEEFLDEIFSPNLLHDVDCKLVLFFFPYFLMVCATGGTCGFYDLRKTTKWNKVIDVHMYLVIFVYMHGMFAYQLKISGI